MDEAEAAVPVAVPVSELESDPVVAAEVLLRPEALRVALTRMAPVPVADAVALPMGKKVEVVLATEDVLEETMPLGTALEATRTGALVACEVAAGTEDEEDTEVRVIVLVSWRVCVVVPLVVSSAAARFAPAARTVRRMLEMCILRTCVCCDEKSNSL